MGLLETTLNLLGQLPVVEVLRDRRVRRYDHDRAKFEALESVLPEEALDRFLDEIYQGNIRRPTLDPIYDYFEWQRKRGNRFTITAIQRDHQALADALMELKEFSASIFAPAENSEKVFVLTSYYKRREEDRQRLFALIKEVDAAWTQFRNVVKRRLLV